MADRITIGPAERKVVVRTGDAIIAESHDALVLREEGHAPVYYLPRADVAMEFVDRSDKVTHCPLKGEATHYHIAGIGGAIENAAWSYESPKPGAEAIAGYLAFYPENLAIES